jgi:hypothetical protein
MARRFSADACNTSNGEMSMPVPPLPEDTTIEQVTQWLREQYPSAVAVTLFVNYYEHEITTRRRSPDRARSEFEPSSMKRLDGQWA